MTVMLVVMSLMMLGGDAKHYDFMLVAMVIMMMTVLVGNPRTNMIAIKGYVEASSHLSKLRTSCGGPLQQAPPMCCISRNALGELVAPGTELSRILQACLGLTKLLA